MNNFTNSFIYFFFAETITLSTLSLRQQLLNAITSFSGPLLTIPLQWRQMFQVIAICSIGLFCFPKMFY